MLGSSSLQGPAEQRRGLARWRRQAPPPPLGASARRSSPGAAWPGQQRAPRCPAAGARLAGVPQPPARMPAPPHPPGEQVVAQVVGREVPVRAVQPRSQAHDACPGGKGGVSSVRCLAGARRLPLGAPGGAAGQAPGRCGPARGGPPRRLRRRPPALLTSTLSGLPCRPSCRRSCSAKDLTVPALSRSTCWQLQAPQGCCCCSSRCTRAHDSMLRHAITTCAPRAMSPAATSLPARAGKRGAGGGAGGGRRQGAGGGGGGAGRARWVGVGSAGGGKQLPMPELAPVTTQTSPLRHCSAIGAGARGPRGDEERRAAARKAFEITVSPTMVDCYR
jgi:hypothetical protein